MSVTLCLLIILMYVLSRPEIARLPQIDILEMIEAKTLDLRFRLRGTIEPQDDVVIIEIDDRTEDELGRWQSAGRQWLAQLLDILRDGNARVVGFDLTLAEPDAGVNAGMLNDLKTLYQDTYPDVIAQHPGMLTALDDTSAAHDYDRQLAAAIQQSGTVLLGLYFFDSAAAAHLTPEQHAANTRLIERVRYENIQFPADTTEPPLRVRHAAGVEPNLSAFSDAAHSLGHFNVLPDGDGIVRHSPLLLEHNGGYYPSLALEMVRTYVNPPLPPIIHALGREGGGSVDTIELGKTLIPCDEEGKLLINYYGPERMFPYYSLVDVLSGDVPAFTFTNKIVLVGVTSIIIKDLLAVPFQPDGTYPGVEINATIIENILRRQFLNRPEWTTAVEAALILLLGIMLGIIRLRKGPFWVMGIGLLSIVVVFMLGYMLFVAGHVWLNVTFPVLFILVDYVVLTSYKYFTEERQKRYIKHAFQHYVSPELVDRMTVRIDTLKLGGERKELTALFSDIRGFTNISENMPPETLVDFLNGYLSEMTQIVLQHGGTVDKYMGDAIMAFYGAPLEQAGHAVHACRTAVDMMVRLKELQAGWEAHGLPPMDIGIGINTGDMNVGNMGSRERFDYTIMGDNVNLASRLESINKFYGTNIVISEFTYNACRECREHSWIVRELDTVRVKGKNEPVTIYELMGYGSLYEHKQALADLFGQGLAAYKQRQWPQASDLFEHTLQQYPNDKPSQLYSERCTEYAQEPPPDDWDGAFVMTTK